MKNLARGSVALTAVALLVLSFYFQRKVEAVSVVAIDSQNEIQDIQKTHQSEQQQEQQQQVQEQQQEKDSKNSIKSEDKETLTVTIENLDTKNAKGSTAKSSGAGAFTATAYCLQGRTALGHSVRRGIVAADPRVLPLGTKISLNAGSYSGSYLVADTGGAVRGKKLDIWVPSCSEAKRFGRRSVSVSVAARK